MRKEVEVGVREQRGARSWREETGEGRVTKIRVWLARLGKAAHPKPFLVGCPPPTVPPHKLRL